MTEESGPDILLGNARDGKRRREETMEVNECPKCEGYGLLNDNVTLCDACGATGVLELCEGDQCRLTLTTDTHGYDGTT